MFGIAFGDSYKLNMNDAELLRQFAERGAEDAFRELVDRHINVVYSAAHRAIVDPRLAEEVAQTVFIILARKAGGLVELRSLTAWLQRTTRLAALEALRRDCRRREREEKYAQMDHANTESVWEQIAPHLDEVMLQLGETDRQALALRFFESKSFQDVARALGTGEDAARMRVNRAVEKLRGLFARRGIVVPASVLLVAVSAHSVQAAPAGLAASIASAALAQKSLLTTPALVKGTLKIMAWTKTRTAVAAGVVALLTAGTATVTIKTIEATGTSGGAKAGPYNWQVASLTRDNTTLEGMPPLVDILPTKFPNRGGARVGGRGNKFAGLNQSSTNIIEMAYGYADRVARVIVETDLPEGRYDFISSLPSKAALALQGKISETFGVVARRETRETEGLLLTVKNLNAQGLKPSGKSLRSGGSSHSTRGGYTWNNASLPQLASFLEAYLKIPVVDQTGLTQGYEIELKWGGFSEFVSPDVLKQTVLDQLGLELVPTNMPIEMLVVEKAAN